MHSRLGSEKGKKTEELEELEEIVREAVHTQSDDLLLNYLIELAYFEIDGKDVLGVPVIDTPVFWRRYFVRWVREVVEEDEALRRIERNEQ